MMDFVDKPLDASGWIVFWSSPGTERLLSPRTMT
jgi:hypothetical protein